MFYTKNAKKIVGSLTVRIGQVPERLIRGTRTQLPPCYDFFRRFLYLYCAPAGRNFVQGKVKGCGFPGPKSGTLVDEMGRPENGWSRFVLSHPCDKSNYVTRMGPATRSFVG